VGLAHADSAEQDDVAVLDGFDWSWPKKINRAQVQQMFRPSKGDAAL
jgi:hypothetical protein